MGGRSNYHLFLQFHRERSLPERVWQDKPSRRTIKKRSMSITKHKTLRTRRAILCARDSPVKLSYLLRARRIRVIMRIHVVQWDRATFHGKLECVNRVRSTRLWKSEKWETEKYARVIHQLCLICCVKGVSQYGTANPSRYDCCNTWNCDAYHLG